MPHVVLTGALTLEAVFSKLKPLLIRHDEGVLRTMDAYLDKNKRSILIESLAIEAGNKTSFFTMISSRDDGVVVRVYPKVEVEKSEGVKTILAEQAKQLLASFPELAIGETNLTDFLN